MQVTRMLQDELILSWNADQATDDKPTCFQSNALRKLLWTHYACCMQRTLACKNKQTDQATLLAEYHAAQI